MTGVAGDRVLAEHPAPTPPAGRSLERNSAALAGSALVTGLVGLVYWIVVGRLYPAREVGAAAAVLTTATMLAAFGNLSIGALFERFLPAAGDRSKTMIRTGFTVGAGFGALLAGGFLLFGPTDEMFHGTGDALLFPLVVAVFSAFALLDHTAVGQREAGWAAVKNVTHAVAKLALVVVFSLTASRLAVVGTWTVPAAIAVWWLGRRVWRRAGEVEVSGVVSGLPPRRDLASYLAGAYGSYVVGALAPLLLPLIVIGTLGADANAYFAIAWSLVTSVLVLMTMLMGPYVAAAAATPERAWPLTLRFFGVLATVAAAGVVLFALVGPWILALVGPGYAAAGTPLLRWAALAVVPAAITIAYGAVARVRRRLRLAVAAQALSAVLILGPSLYWITEHGLVALGRSYVLAETAAALVVAIPLASALRAMRRTAQRSVN